MAAEPVIEDGTAIETMRLNRFCFGQLSIRLIERQIDTLFLFSERHSYDSFCEKEE
jgi:hypothetical protein